MVNYDNATLRGSPNFSLTAERIEKYVKE